MLLLSESASRRPKIFLSLAGVISLLIFLLVALPSIWPASFPLLHSIQIDTDPENMLSAEEPVRVTHNSLRHEFNLHDMLVVGVVNQHHPQGVFNQATLTRVYQLTTYAQSLIWQDDGKQKGVIGVDLIAPSSVDNIEQAGLGSIRFEWLMAQPPQSETEAISIADKASRIPFLKDTLVSSDRKALALYIPISEKS